ncbi:hypothetical protein ACWOEP_03090, partial [Dolosicoccus paucivorans]
DAYSAYQRGTNEQINGQIRRHIPKGSIIRDYSKAQIKSIEEWINNYPRGIHAGHSALDVQLIVKRSFAAGKHMIYIAFIAQMT